MSIITESRVKALQILSDIQNLKPSLSFVDHHKMSILTCEKIIQAINGENKYKKELYIGAISCLKQNLREYEERGKEYIANNIGQN